ncbi:MAG TPA: hypothetical protein PLO41_16995, partial [Rubrivivax sp.]|nr:hypothetical protein [Rubrivivax sp.]
GLRAFGRQTTCLPLRLGSGSALALDLRGREALDLGSFGLGAFDLCTFGLCTFGLCTFDRGSFGLGTLGLRGLRGLQRRQPLRLSRSRGGAFELGLFLYAPSFGGAVAASGVTPAAAQLLADQTAHGRDGQQPEK